MSNDFTQAQETPWRYGFLNLMRRVDVQLLNQTLDVDRYVARVGSATGNGVHS